MTKTENPNKKFKSSVYRTVKNAQGLIIGLGDLVEFEWTANRFPYKPIRMKGIVQGLPPDWYVADHHASIRDCIVNIEEITKVIKRQAIDPELMKYLHRW